MIVLLLLASLLRPQTCDEYNTLITPFMDNFFVIADNVLTGNLLEDKDATSQSYKELVAIRQQLEMVIPPQKCLEEHLARVFLVNNYLAILSEARLYHLNGNADGVVEAISDFVEASEAWND
jgi:hypothetical protein